MKTSLLKLAALLTLFFLFSLPFGGFPRRMPLVSRKISEKSACMVGDKHHDDVVGKLNHRKPDIVLIGNSMLGEAVDEKLLEQLMSVPVASVWEGGVGSAWWYLVVKNVVPQLTKKPSAVGIFFRDKHLTMPSMRVTGKHKRAIDDLCADDEELLDRLAYFGDRNFLQMLLGRHVPMFNEREKTKEDIDFFIKEHVGGLFGADASKAIAAVFDSRRMNSALLGQRQLEDERKQEAADEKMPFRSEKTFLDPMVKACRDMNISLVLVRVKRRRDLQRGKQSENLIEYMNQLKTYLKRHDVALIDYTDNEAIRSEHFGEGDHLNRQSGRPLFTAMLADDLKRALARQKVEARPVR